MSLLLPVGQIGTAGQEPHLYRHRHIHSRRQSHCRSFYPPSLVVDYHERNEEGNGAVEWSLEKSEEGGRGLHESNEIMFTMAREYLDGVSGVVMAWGAAWA